MASQTFLPLLIPSKFSQETFLLLDHLDIFSFHFVGLSLGSMIGLWLSSNSSNRVKRLVLAGASAKVLDSTAFEKRINHIKIHGLDSMFNELDARWYADGFPTMHPSIVKEIHTMVAKTPIDGYIAATIAVRDFDITDRLSDIKAPLLLITGAEDKATPLSEAKLIAETCANAKLITIENASHLALVENPMSLIPRYSIFFHMLMNSRIKIIDEIILQTTSPRPVF